MLFSYDRPFVDDERVLWRAEQARPGPDGDILVEDGILDVRTQTRTVDD